MKNRRSIAIILIVLFCLTSAVEEWALRVRPQLPTTAQTSSVYALAGEFRVVFANLLWIRAEKYHHEFTAKNNDWTKNHELLGLIRLIVQLDPHFIEAYDVGYYMYSHGNKNNREAKAFLDEGLTNNPKSWKLNQSAAIFYTRDLKNPASGLYYAKRAYKYSDDPFYKKVNDQLVQTIQRILKTGK